MTWWWRSSIAISWVFCGPRGKPFCARVHEAKPGFWRTAFMVAADIAFGEADHCAGIHRRWRQMK